MAGRIESRLRELGISLPHAPLPVANYVAVVQSGNLLFVSGQLPLQDGVLTLTGRVGLSVSLEQAAAAARLCAINIVAQVRAAIGDLDRVVRCVRLGGFVSSADDFNQQPQVINGASDVMVEIFGDAGRHARTAVGVNVLPRGTPVEVDAIFEIS